MADNSSLTFLQFFLPVFFFLSPSHLLSLLLPARLFVEFRMVVNNTLPLASYYLSALSSVELYDQTTEMS
uniref:Conotoxin Superfamily SF1 n=1 Tax=Conus episcopatus TaxID=88764 RepID=A0A0K2S707_CONEP|nr:Conotoxin Superfamily SF1 [Conus episcopatus]